VLYVVFSRGADTILGETSDPRELFLVDDCQDTAIDFIVNKVQVALQIVTHSKNWHL